MVLFIAPARRCKELWPELVDRCEDKGLEVWDETGELPNWRTVRTSKGRLALASWSFVLDRLEGRLEEAGRDDGAHEVWQLKGLCQRLEEPIQLGEDHSDSEQRKAQLRSIVDEVSRRLSEAGLFEAEGFRATPGPHYYRRFGTLAGRMVGSIAYDEQYADRFKETLLWLRGHKGSAEAFGPSVAGAGHPFRCYKLDSRLLFPLDIPEQAARGGRPIPSRPSRWHRRSPTET